MWQMQRCRSHAWSAVTASGVDAVSVEMDAMTSASLSSLRMTGANVDMRVSLSIAAVTDVVSASTPTSRTITLCSPPSSSQNDTVIAM